MAISSNSILLLFTVSYAYIFTPLNQADMFFKVEICYIPIQDRIILRTL